MQSSHYFYKNCNSTERAKYFAAFDSDQNALNALFNAKSQEVNHENAELYTGSGQHCSTTQGVAAPPKCELKYVDVSKMMKDKYPSLQRSCGHKAGAKRNPQSTHKVHVLGRDRVVTKMGRASMVTYRGQKITLTEARTLEKKQQQKKK